MSSKSFADLLAEAEAEGISTWTPESGPYHLKAMGANGKINDKNQTPVFGLRWVVVGGPFDGKSFWDNFRFASPQNTAITLRTLTSLDPGFGDFLGTLTGPIADNLDAVVDRLKAIEADVDLTVKKNGDFTNFSYKVTKDREDYGDGPAPAPAAAEVPPGEAQGALGVDDEEPF